MFELSFCAKLGYYFASIVLDNNHRVPVTLLVMIDNWKVNAIKELFEGRITFKIMRGWRYLKQKGKRWFI